MAIQNDRRGQINYVPVLIRIRANSTTSQSIYWLVDYLVNTHHAEAQICFIEIKSHLMEYSQTVEGLTLFLLL